MRGRTRGPRLPHEPVVVRAAGPTAAETGVERPVASAGPEMLPERVVRGAPPLRPPLAPVYWRVEPVVPDAPELRDPSAEPVPGRVQAREAKPVPPIVRKRR